MSIGGQGAQGAGEGESDGLRKGKMEQEPELEPERGEEEGGWAPIHRASADPEWVAIAPSACLSLSHYIQYGGGGRPDHRSALTSVTASHRVSPRLTASHPVCANPSA